jgi:hypothetical protein
MVYNNLRITHTQGAKPVLILQQLMQYKWDLVPLEEVQCRASPASRGSTLATALRLDGRSAVLEYYGSSPLEGWHPLEQPRGVVTGLVCH